MVSWKPREERASRKIGWSMELDYIQNVIPFPTKSTLPFSYVPYLDE